MRVQFLLTAFLATIVYCAQAQNSSPYWSLAGNSNASTSSKLGTTTSVPLNLVTNNATRMYISTSGNVGIGTTAPSTKLHIIDQVNRSGYFKPLMIYNPSLATGQHIQLAIGRANSTYNQGEINFNLVGGSGSSSNTLSFGLYGKPTILTLQGTGNVGIGTSTPLYKLQVKDTESTAIYGESLPNSNYGYKYGGGAGVEGKGYYGVSGNGVRGLVGTSNQDGDLDLGYWGVGVYGTSYTDYGRGVMGEGTQAGIEGRSQNVGVRGEGGFAGVAGVNGPNDWTNGRGVYGYSYDTYGGEFNSEEGDALHATAGTLENSLAAKFDGNVYASGVFQSSDKNLKQNVQEFGDALGILGKLKPRNYEFKSDPKLAALHLPKGQHYGLIAQDVEEVLPGLVREVIHELNPPKPQDFTARTSDKTTTGEQQPKRELPKPEMLTTKAVNYIELIPIMIKGMQEQEAEIKAKDDKIADLEARLQKIETLLNGNNNTVTSISASLEQNTPNPTSGTTTIRYHIPATATAAHLAITNAKGQLVKTISITGNSSGQVNLNSMALAAGTYNYSLFVDGKQVDTKRLIIAR